MTSIDYSTMNKAQLRAACKAAGVAYGKLDNTGMRAALAALTGVVADSTPATAAPAAQEETVAKKTVKAKAPKVAKVKDENAQPSVRTWLDSRVAQYGSVKLEDAKKFVADTGRSAVTMYRQAQELGLRIDREKKAFVKA